RVAGARERVVDLGEIVSVDDERFPSERLDARGVRVGVPLELGGAALAEAVHVDDRRDVVQALVAAEVEALPDRSFGALAVAHEGPDVERRVPQTLRGERHADRDRHALSERAGRDVDPWEQRRRMALESRAELAEGHELR